MERSERAGLGIAAAGHVVLFGALSLGWLSSPEALKPSPPAMDVSLVDEVALDATAPAAVEPPAPSQAPVQGPPEESAAPAPAEPAPMPAPPAPKPAPAKPVPAAKPKPQKPAPPAPATKPQPAKSKGVGTSTAKPAVKQPRGQNLGDLLKGIVANGKPVDKGQVPRAATMDAAAAADIGSAIRRQVQPCANRQVQPGPGANRIKVSVRLRINRDGSLAGRPEVVGHTGVDDDNSRYVARVDDLAIAAFVGCAPLRGLPTELYDVPRGWRVFRLIYDLPKQG